MDVDASEDEECFMDGDEDSDDDVCDVKSSKSNKSRDDNEMNEVYQVVKETHMSLQVWRIVALLILVCTFAAILTCTFILINAENNNDDEEAVSEAIEVSLSWSRPFSYHIFWVFCLSV